MRGLAISLAALTVLAGCGAPRTAGPVGGPVAPAQVTLFPDTVTARMSDGTLCTGVREGRAGPWATTLAGCPHGWPVEVAQPTNRPRLPLAPSATAPWVTLGAPDGPLGFAPPG